MAVFKTLKSKILVTILGSLLAGLIIMISLSTVVVIHFAEDSADDTADAMRDEELKNLDRLTADKAELVDVHFKEVEAEMHLFESYVNDLFNGEVNTSHYTSYNGVTTIQAELPPGGLVYEQKYNRSVNYESSVWYIPGLSSLDELDNDTRELINLSSNLDIVFKTIRESNPAYSGIFMGFENEGFFRIYPYKRLDHYLSMKEYTCASSGLDVTIYDPRCRAWYQNAVEEDGLVFTAYMDASGLGLLVSAAMPIKIGDDLLGVISVDLTIKSVEESVLGLKVLDHGYAYMVDSEGNAILHPDIDPSIEEQPIEDLEFTKKDPKEIYEFNKHLDSMELGETGRGSFTKNGEKWYLSYAPIETTNYSMVLVATEDDILGPSDDIRSDIISSLYAQLSIFLIIIIIVGGMIVGFAVFTSRRIVQPVRELTELTDQISSGNLGRDVTGEAGGSKEISMLFTTFQGLITALRFGNDEYYAGKIDLAMKNYIAALNLFTTLDNQKGIGICHNNIGNIHRAQGAFQEAETSYQQAIMIGNELLESAKEEEKKGLNAALASRYNNIGLLYMAQDQHDKAWKYLNKALELDTQIHNIRGLATRYGNIGQLYLKMGKKEEAKQAFEKGYSIAQDSDSDRVKAYAKMNRGIWKRATGDVEGAIADFAEAAKQAQDLDIRVVRSSLKNLKGIYEEKGDWTLLEQVQHQIDQFKVVVPKDVMFALDHSGSMRGRRIAASLRGLIEIFQNQINPNDRVSFLTFSEFVQEQIELTDKEGNEEEILSTINSLEQPYGTTAFYDALGYAYSKLEAQEGSNEQWLIALTDGDDNGSRQHSSASIQELALRNPNIHLVIIGVGEVTISTILESLCRSSGDGKFIDMRKGDSVENAIEAAFEEVGSMLMEVEVEGFVSDY